MTIKRVGILGSGIMGSGIAEVAAKTGHEVVLRSRKQETADAMVASLTKSLAKQVERGKLTEDERDAVLSRVTATDHIGAVADCDLVIESVVEDMDVKKALFAELDGICKDSAIIATNTSTLSVIDMAVATNRPDKVVGVHFFNPAPMMALVEIVRPLTASDETACSRERIGGRAGAGVARHHRPSFAPAVRLRRNVRRARDASRRAARAMAL